MPDIPQSQRLIEIDATQLDQAYEGHLESATVVDRLHLPDTFELVFRDPTRDVLKLAGIEIKKRVKISTGSLGSDASSVLIDGEVTSIEAEYDPRGSTTIVRGYDMSHRLNAGRKSKTYLQMPYSDIAKDIAGKAQLDPDIEPTQKVHDYVVQANQSDLDFLMGLAREVDYDCRVDGDKLIFRKPTRASDGPGPGDAYTTEDTKLVWGTNLHEFRARMSAVAQVGNVKVRGWDPVKKEAVIGQASVTATHADLKTKPAALSEPFGPNSHVIVDVPVNSQDDADALAKAKAEQVGSSALEVTAICSGSAKLRAGASVSFEGVDEQLKGNWSISSSTHKFGKGTYTTVCECSGRQDRSLSGTITNALREANSRPKYYGVVVGIVTENNDPEQLARVKVKFPWLDENVESDWARVALPGAGPDRGLVMLPQIDDEVLVGFEFGDVRRPYVLGGLWNGVDKPPLGETLFDSGTVKRRGIVSRKGHKLIFFDADDNSGIALISANDKFKVSLNEKTDELHIVSKGKLVIEARELEIKVDAGASLEAGGQIKIKGATVALN